MDRRDIAFAIVILVLMFLFGGEPDIFDVLREAAMKSLRAHVGG